MKWMTSLGTTAAAVAGFVSGAYSTDDTFGCLDTYGGPLVVKSGTFDESGFIRPSTLEPNTRFDLRDAVFEKTNVNAVVFLLKDVPGIPACVAGGTIIGLQARDMSWHDSHAGNCATQFNGPNSTMDGLRGDNIANDFISVSPGGTEGFVIRNNWGSWVRDDCIEDDHNNGGVVEDNLFDGCYMFFSLQDECSPNCAYRKNVAIHRNLIHLQNMPYPYVGSSRQGIDNPADGWGGFFKQATSDNDPAVDFVENVIYMEPNHYNYYKGQRIAVREFSSCNDNVLIWTGSDDWPDTSWQNLPDGCLEAVYRGQEGVSVWNAIKKNWIDCHPKVARISGDPESETSACDDNAYGGSGTITRVIPSATADSWRWERGRNEVRKRASSTGTAVIYSLDGRRLGDVRALSSAGNRLPAGVVIAAVRAEDGSTRYWPAVVDGRLR